MNMVAIRKPGYFVVTKMLIFAVTLWVLITSIAIKAQASSGTYLELVSATIDPQNSKIIYVSTYVGLYKTVNGGETWDLINDKQTIDRGSVIVIDPNNISVMYTYSIGRTDADETICGIIKSVDSGFNWYKSTGHLPGGYNCPPYNVLIDPNNSSILYVSGGTRDGSAIYKSADAGLNWEKIADFTDSSIVLAIGRQRETSVLYAGFTDRTSSRILKSVDNGKSWIDIDGGFNYTDEHPAHLKTIAVSRRNANVIYAVLSEKLYKSADGGKNWEELKNSPYVKDEAWHKDILLTNNPNILYLTTDSGIYRSTNGGRSWRRQNRTDPLFIAVDPKNHRIVYVIDDFGELGLYKSTNSGRKFEPILSQPLVIFDNYSTDIEFSIPDEDSMVEAKALPGTFASGSVVVITNDMSGYVLTLTAGNDGSIQGTLPATINDALTVVVTTPKGQRRTGTASRYVREDGNVFIGPGGGIVTAPGGFELRVPSGALDSAALLKIESFDNPPDELPYLSGGRYGGGIKLTMQSETIFQREAELTFPRPADAPTGSFYYVYRRVENPDSRVWFEAVSDAFLNRTGDQVAMVAPRYPFPGVIGGSTRNDYILMWEYNAKNNALMSPVATQGVITGRVRRTLQQDVDTNVLPLGVLSGDKFAPIHGVHVQLIDADGNDLPGLETYTQSDGRFAFWDRSNDAFWDWTNDLFGLIPDPARMIRATTPNGEVIVAYVYRHAEFTTLWEHYKYVGTATITFPSDATLMKPVPVMDKDEP